MDLVATLVESVRVDMTCVDATIWFDGTVESLRAIGPIPSLSDAINGMLTTLATDLVFESFEMDKYANIIV